MEKSEFNKEMFSHMVKIACEDFSKAEYEGLPSESEIEHTFSPEFEKKMEALSRDYGKGRLRRERAALYGRRRLIIALAALIVIALAVTAYAFRFEIFNAFIEENKNNDGIEFYEPGSLSSVLPYGFTEQNGGNTIHFDRIIFENAEGEIVFYEWIAKDNGKRYQVDNELTSRGEKNLGGVTVTLFSSDGSENGNYITWEDSDKYCRLYSSIDFTRLEEVFLALNKTT